MVQRSGRNARVLSPAAAAGSDAWAVPAWLVPVVNLWVPRRLLLDVRRVGDGASGTAPREGLVNAWWAAWAGHGVVAAGFLTGEGDRLALLVVRQGLLVVAAALVICVIQRPRHCRAPASRRCHRPNRSPGPEPHRRQEPSPGQVRASTVGGTNEGTNPGCSRADAPPGGPHRPSLAAAAPRR
ncbi:DUF4328 domain-containing protein [Streptomyces sp. NPDC004008]